MSKTWDKLSSRILLYFYRLSFSVSKDRLWVWLRRLAGTPRLTIPYSRDSWITVEGGNFQERTILLTGRTHEPEILDVVQRHLAADEVVWDVGANIGSFAIDLMRHQQVKIVYAFEPHPLIKPILAHNLRLNSENYVLHPFAVGDHVGQIRLYYAPAIHQAVMASVVDTNQAESTLVDAVSGDYLVAQKLAQPPTIMKIDVEGNEHNVLKGCTTLLHQTPPKLIVFETLCNGDGHIQNREMAELLKRAGYTVEHIPRRSGMLHHSLDFAAGSYTENFAAYQ